VAGATALKRQGVVSPIFLRIFFIFLLLLTVAYPVFAAKESGLATGAMPAWVIDLVMPDLKQERMRSVEDGIYYLIQDDQVKIGSQGDQFFSRTAKKVTDRSGLESAAETQIVFDPATEKVILHRAAIWRAGKMIDYTKSADIEILRREDELESGIITGDKTALIRLPDVRAGDITDFAWSWVDTKTYWSGHHFSTHSLGWSVPVATTHVRIVKPRAMVLTSKLSNGAPKPSQAFVGDDEIWTWNIADADPVPGEEDRPEWIEPWAKVEISTMNSWQGVTDWARPLYEIDPALPPDLSAKVDEIASATSDPMMRVTRSLRLVQDSVRYTSISIGLDGYRPHAPAATWRNGYGDCKDKTMLLIAILQRLGIVAVPALTGIDDGPGLDEVLPSANAFDHVIVRVDGLKQPLWLDPTGSYEGGVAPNLADLPYGYALPLRAGQNKLEVIAAAIPKQPTMIVDETHTRTANGMSISIKTTSKGDEANIARSSNAAESLSNRETKDLKYYSGIYPGIEQNGAFKFTDDRNRNVVTVEQNYIIPSENDDFEDTVAAYPIDAWSLTDVYKTPASASRKTAFALPVQINREHNFTIITPSHRPALPEEENISGEGFYFKRAASRDGDSMTVNLTLQGKARMLAAKDVKAYRKDAKKLAELNYAYIDLNEDTLEGKDGLLFLSLLLFFSGGGMLLYLSVKQLQKAEDADEVTGVLRPIGLAKFTVMVICTSGMYSAYWMWRCWRRYRQTEGVDILPFWRAVFEIFWIYPLFTAAREKSERQFHIAVGILVLLAVILSGIFTSMAEMKEWPFVAKLAVNAITPLLILPVVIQVNRANSAESIAQNSAFRPVHWIAMICGLTFTILIMTDFY
jgi:hypothetical protein